MRRAAVGPLGATLAALLAAGLVTALPAGPALPQTAPAPGPTLGLIRVNQQGYLPGEPKQARLMTTAPVHDARYRVTDHAENAPVGCPHTRPGRGTPGSRRCTGWD